jgi:hypothetical protein
MSRRTTWVLVVSLVLCAAAGCRDESPFQSGVETEAKPWTNLNFKDTSDNFHFAIVSDRTGGLRPGVFAKGCETLNLLEPAFVICVGDLVAGYTPDEAKLREQWDELRGMTGSLEMPFFYVAGNHDTSSDLGKQVWDDLFGTQYYWFEYRDVLFLVLASCDNPKGTFGLSREQIDWAKDVLARHSGVRWTFIFTHQPLWQGDAATREAFAEIEEALGERPATLFCGHYHNYCRYERGGRRYYILATTGGGTRGHDPDMGSFDHVTWVSMTDDGPRIANVLLSRVLPEDVYTEAHKDFYAGFGVKPESRVTAADSPLETTLLLRPTNPYKHPLEATLAWTVDPASGWSVKPMNAKVSFDPGETEALDFTARFEGNLADFFPLPFFTVEITSEGSEPRRSRGGVPIDPRPFIMKHRRTSKAAATAEAPKIDGRLDEALWKRAADVDRLIPIDLVSKASVPTEAWLAWDAENLYLAVRATETDIANLRVQDRERDEAVHRDASIELFLDTNLDRKTFYQFVVNANGSVADGMTDDAGFHRDWNGQFSAATGRAGDAWTLEVAVPWKTLGIAAPKAGDKMGLELCRNAAGVLQWAPTAAGNHVPDMFGTVEFTGP